MSNISKQKYCNISTLQFKIMEALDRGLTYRRELEFELSVMVKSVDRSLDALVGYGIVNAISINESASPHLGKRIVRFELSGVGREMLAVLRKINCE